MLIFDIETDGLLDELTKVHTIHILDKATGQRTRYNDGFFADGTPAPRDGSIVDGLMILAEADAVCGHNIIGFDIPAITKVYPWFRLKLTCSIHDTIVYARLVWPNLKEIDSAAIKKGKRPEGFGRLTGSHALKAWGIRLGVLKRDYEGEWHSFTQELEMYAEQDPVTTEALWDKIVEKDFCPASVELEQDVQRIIFLQERFGFLFDMANAERLEIELRGRKAELEDELRATFKPWVKPVTYKGQPVVVEAKRRTKVRRWNEAGEEFTVEVLKGETYEKLKLVSFNPGSRQQIAERLIELYGWIPVEFTDSGQPKVDETTLGSLDHIPAARLLVDYLTVDKRLGQLADGDNAWMKKVKADGRIHGRVNTLGAITRRMTHSDPNMAQVPSLVNAKGPVPYGKECRSLFIVAKGKLLCGCDAEGLELRMLAHYMAKHDGGSYGDTVVNGQKDDGTDVHTVNQRLIRLNSRNSAKTWIYAYLYGAGLLKLGMVIYEDFSPAQREAFNAKHEAGPAREKAIARLGKQARQRVEEGLPALGQLQAKIKRLAARGYLETVDGGKLKVRSAHSALNTLLQGGGAIVMKKALVILFNRLVEAGWVPNMVTGELRRGEDVMGFVANIHDEFQMEVPDHLADEVGEMGKDAIRDAGLAYNLRCPLAGSFDKGRNWAASH
jgi:DNA polymerase I-like protein with 3'-5' exonuclease and polymerase domains